MSILKITHDDTVPGGKGKPLPNGTYRVTVESCGPVPHENSGGTQFERQYGNIRTRDGLTEVTLPNGSTYRIGNRKLFARSWIDHPNEQATEIGQREIKKEAMSAGLVRKPAKGETVDLPFDSFEALGAALAGRDVTVRTEQRPRKDKAGKVKKDDEGQTIIDAEIVDWIVE